MTPDPGLLGVLDELAIQIQRLNRRLRNAVIVVGLLVVAVAGGSYGGL